MFFMHNFCRRNSNLIGRTKKQRYFVKKKIYSGVKSSLAENPKCWDLGFQLVEIFAVNFITFAKYCHFLASKFVVSVNSY